MSAAISSPESSGLGRIRASGFRCHWRCQRRQPDCFGSTDRGKRLALFDLDASDIAPRTILRYDGLGPATVAATALVTGTPEHDGLYFVDFFPEPFEDPDGDVTAPGARLWRVRATTD